MPHDPSACFSPSFVAGFEAAVAALPGDYRPVTWANSEKGLVAAMLGPVRAPFVVGLEEGSVWLIDRQAGEKLEVGPVASVTGAMVVTLMLDVLARRDDRPA